MRIKLKNARPLARRGRRIGDDDPVTGFLQNQASYTLPQGYSAGSTGNYTYMTKDDEGNNVGIGLIPEVQVTASMTPAQREAQYREALVNQISNQGGAEGNNNRQRISAIINNVLSKPEYRDEKGALNQAGYAALAQQQHFGVGSHYYKAMDDAALKVFNTASMLTALPGAIAAPGALLRGLAGGVLGDMTGRKVGNAISNIFNVDDRTRQIIGDSAGLAGSLFGGGWLAPKSTTNLRNAAIRGVQNYRNQNGLYSTIGSNPRNYALGNKPDTANTVGTATISKPKTSSVNISRKGSAMRKIEKGIPVSAEEAVNDPQFMQQYNKYVQEANASVEGGYDPVANFSTAHPEDATLRQIRSHRGVSRPDVEHIGIPTVAYREGYNVGPQLTKDGGQIIISPEAAESVSSMTPEQFASLQNAQQKVGLNPTTQRQALDNSVGIITENPYYAGMHEKLNNTFSDEFTKLVNSGMSPEQVATTLGYRDYGHMISSMPGFPMSGSRYNPKMANILNDWLNAHPLFRRNANGIIELPEPTTPYINKMVKEPNRMTGSADLVYDRKGKPYAISSSRTPSIHVPELELNVGTPVNSQWMSNLSPDYVKAVVGAQDGLTPIGSGFTEHSLSINSYPLQALNTTAKINRGKGASTFLLPNSNNVVMQPMNGLGVQQVQLADGTVAGMKPVVGDLGTLQNQLQGRFEGLLKASGGDPSMFPGISTNGRNLFNPQNFFIKTGMKYGGRVKRNRKHYGGAVRRRLESGGQLSY